MVAENARLWIAGGGRTAAPALGHDARLEDGAHQRRHRTLHAVRDDAYLCHLRSAHRADCGHSGGPVAHGPDPAFLVRRSDHPDHLALYCRHRLAAVRHPIHDHDDYPHLRLVPGTAQPPHQLAGRRRLHYLAVRPPTVVSGQLPAFLLRRAEHRSSSAALGKIPRRPAADRSPAASLLDSPRAPLAGRAPAGSLQITDGSAGGLARLVAAQRVLFPPVQPGNTARQPAGRAPEQRRPRLQPRQPPLRRRVPLGDGAVQSQRLALDEADARNQPGQRPAARGLFLRPQPGAGGLRDLLWRPTRPAVRRRVPETMALGNAGGSGVHYPVLCGALAESTVQRHAHRSAPERGTRGVY